MSTTKAKKHPLLGKITESLRGKSPEKVVEVLGHQYLLRLPLPEGMDWVASHTLGTTVSSALLNSRKPAVACALSGISDDDGQMIPIEQLFQPGDDLDPLVREELFKDGRVLRDWRREQILEWLREEVDAYVVTALYAGYTQLESQHVETMKGLENFSKRTSTEG